MENPDPAAHNNEQGKLEQLVRIGLALSSEKDIGKLLEMIVDSMRLISNADGGTLYIVDRNEQSLNYEILQNDTMKTRINLSQNPGAGPPPDSPMGEMRRRRRVEHTVGDVSLPPIPLYIDGKPNLSNVSSYVALKCETVNIPDVYDAKDFNFIGPKTYDAATGYRTKSMLVIPMANYENEVIGVVQLINARNQQTGTVETFPEGDVSFLSSLASQAAVALTNANLIEHLVHDIEEIKKLRDTEKGMNVKIREAYLQTEEVNKDLTAALAKVRVIRRSAFIFGIFIIVGLGGVSLFQGSILGSIKPFFSLAPQKQDVERTCKVVPQTVSSELSLTGVLDPLNVVNVISPISGKVKEIYFNYGEIVKADQVLLQMDTSEVEVKLREAQTIYDKVVEQSAEIEKWEVSSEVARVKRSLTKAKLSLEAQKKAFENTERLYKRGLVSETEYESSQQQYASQQLDFQTAQEELQATLQKGSGTNKNIVLREKKNAETRLVELQRQQQMSRIIAPVSGVITLPPTKGTAGEIKKIDVGSTLQEGGLLFSIGNLTGFSVRARVDEVDILKVHLGQKVRLTGDAFPDITLGGRIDKIFSQAAVDQGGGGSGAPSFEIVVVIDKIPPAYLSKIYVGMSTSLEVQIYDKPDALMAPVTAVTIRDGKRFVTRKTFDGQNSAYQEVEVTTGYSTVDAVEITSGLKAGDEILVAGQ